MHEGKKRKTEETFTIQLGKMEDKKKGDCRDSDIAVGLIKVEDWYGSFKTCGYHF